MKQEKKDVQVEEENSKIPHIFVILFSLIILVSLLSYIIPSGSFERVANTSVAQNFFQFVKLNH